MVRVDCMNVFDVVFVGIYNNNNNLFYLLIECVTVCVCGLGLG